MINQMLMANDLDYQIRTLRSLLRQNNVAEANALALDMIDQGASYVIMMNDESTLSDGLEFNIHHFDYNGIVSINVEGVMMMRHLSKRGLVLFAADCAASVLYLFQVDRPNDDRPRKAIESVHEHDSEAASEASYEASYVDCYQAARFASEAAHAADSKGAHEAALVACYAADANASYHASLANRGAALDSYHSVIANASAAADVSAAAYYAARANGVSIVSLARPLLAKRLLMEVNWSS
jgi:hypothetical protein